MAIADAVKAVNMFLLDSINIPIVGVVENMSWFTPKELPENKYFIFGQGGGQKLVDKTGSALIGQIPLVQGLRESGDSGIPAAYDGEHPLYETFMDVARKLSQQVSHRNLNIAPTQAVQVNK